MGDAKKIINIFSGSLCLIPNLILVISVFGILGILTGCTSFDSSRYLQKQEAAVEVINSSDVDESFVDPALTLEEIQTMKRKGLWQDNFSLTQQHAINDVLMSNFYEVQGGLFNIQNNEFFPIYKGDTASDIIFNHNARIIFDENDQKWILADPKEKNLIFSGKYEDGSPAYAIPILSNNASIDNFYFNYKLADPVNAKGVMLVYEYNAGIKEDTLHFVGTEELSVEPHKLRVDSFQSIANINRVPIGGKFKIKERMVQVKKKSWEPVPIRFKSEREGASLSAPAMQDADFVRMGKASNGRELIGVWIQKPNKLPLFRYTFNGKVKYFEKNRMSDWYIEEIDYRDISQAEIIWNVDEHQFKMNLEDQPGRSLFIGPGQIIGTSERSVNAPQLVDRRDAYIIRINADGSETPLSYVPPMQNAIHPISRESAYLSADHRVVSRNSSGHYAYWDSSVQVKNKEGEELNRDIPRSIINPFDPNIKYEYGLVYVKEKIALSNHPGVAVIVNPINGRIFGGDERIFSLARRLGSIKNSRGRADEEFLKRHEMLYSQVSGYLIGLENDKGKRVAKSCDEDDFFIFQEDVAESPFLSKSEKKLFKSDYPIFVERTNAFLGEITDWLSNGFGYYIYPGKGVFPITKKMLDENPTNGAIPFIDDGTGKNKIIVHLSAKAIDAFPRKGYEKGTTALMLASMKGQERIVRTLIENGADVNLQNSKGATALMTASMKGHKDVVRILIENGADVNARLSKGKTALDVAIKSGYYGVVRILKDAGAKTGKELGIKKDGATMEVMGREQVSKALGSAYLFPPLSSDGA